MKIKIATDLLNLTALNVDQYGQTYLKNNMIKFMIDKTVQFETIL